MIWPKFTKEHPCPACKHSDWNCRAGQRKYICMRVSTDHPAKDGGWYHDYGSTPRFIPLPPRRKAPSRIDLDFEAMNYGFQKYVSYEPLADILNADVAALRAMEAGWSSQHQAWTFPMRDGENNIIGIHLRGETKKCILGSRLGLFVPQIETEDKTAYLPEGASDVCALLSLGYFAIGRPSCNTGGEMLKVMLKNLGIHRVVVVADNDEIKSTGKRPGLEGAKKLKAELGLMSVILMTPSPIKDIRDLVARAGKADAKAIIKSALDSKVWTRV